MANMPRLVAERQLDAISAASVPHMTDKSRKPLIDRLLRRARNERPKTAGEALASLPLEVIYEPRKEVSPDGT